MTKLNTSNDRFKQAMLPSLIMGVLTNVFIFILFYWIGLKDAFYSPLIAIGVFLAGFFMLKMNLVSAQILFIVTGYILAFEVFIHTYYLGWNSGFFYFLFLLPIVFLLNTTWKNWAVISYNCSIVIIISLLRYWYFSQESAFPISEDVQANLSLLNASLTGIVVLVVMYYFSRTIEIKDEALIRANKKLGDRNIEISEQHKHLEVLLKEVHHRVKNNLQIISSLMSLQHRTVEDEEVAEVLNESIRRVEAIALIHQKLCQDEKGNRVDFNSYMHDLVESQKLLSPSVSFYYSSDKVVLSLDKSVPLGLIISEIITNSIKHAFDGIQYPTISIRLDKIGNNYSITVKDNGVGLPSDFNLDEPKSLGMEIVKALGDQIDADIHSKVVKGTSFIIVFEDKLEA
ncbi:MAG: sensor histidine kinase [Crocinitomicaceae bacterium]|nr:sensor histidine kinase [Crocinitomicaceae bacterium]